MLSAEFTTMEITCGSEREVSQVGISLEMCFVLFEAESCHISQASLSITVVLWNGGIAGVHHHAWLSLAFQRIKQRAQYFRGLAEWTTWSI